MTIYIYILQKWYCWTGIKSNYLDGMSFKVFSGTINSLFMDISFFNCSRPIVLQGTEWSIQILWNSINSLSPSKTSADAYDSPHNNSSAVNLLVMWILMPNWPLRYRYRANTVHTKPPFSIASAFLMTLEDTDCTNVWLILYSIMLSNDFWPATWDIPEISS